MNNRLRLRPRWRRLAAAVLCVLPASAMAAAPAQLQALVSETILPLMQQQQIPGMAVAVIYQGKPWFFTYGQADVARQRPVTRDTLFELGSVSKTFTGTAGGYAAASGLVNLNDPAAGYGPELRGAQWRQITLLQLATYTAGGLPLQLPDAVTDEKRLWDYYRGWQPQWPPGTMRRYSNASIGLFGALAVKKSGLGFEQYLQQHVLTPLKLEHTFFRVPEAEASNYAWGYGRDGKPLRVTPGMLDAEAYGIKTTVADMATFMQANIDGPRLKNRDPLLAKAIGAAQSGYYRAGEMYQGLGWESWPLPVNPERLIAASANDIALKPAPVEPLRSAREPLPASWLHKTGSTNGFGAYIALIPERRVGIVMLANKNYPNPQRVTAAWHILSQLQ